MTTLLDVFVEVGGFKWRGWLNCEDCSWEGERRCHISRDQLTQFVREVTDGLVDAAGCRLAVNKKEVNAENGSVVVAPPESGGWCGVEVLGRLPGGKGGFGSLLRGQKGGKRKTTSVDACRDLSGRRIRHARAIERLNQWIENKKREEECIRALGGGGDAEQTLRELEEASKEVHLDEKFIDELRTNSSNIGSVVQRGLQALQERLDAMKERELQEKKERRAARRGGSSSSASSSMRGIGGLLPPGMVDENDEDEISDDYDEEDDDDGGGMETIEEEQEDEEDEEVQEVRGKSNRSGGEQGQDPRRVSSSERKADEVERDDSRGEVDKDGSSGDDDQRGDGDEDEEDEELDIELEDFLEGEDGGENGDADDAKAISELIVALKHLRRIDPEKRKQRQRGRRQASEPSLEKSGEQPIAAAEGGDSGEKGKGSSLLAADVCVEQFESAEQLENEVEGEAIKAKLVSLGMKSGGTPAERAARLFLLKTCGTVDRLPKSVFAKRQH